jgi:hypothetical protein
MSDDAQWQRRCKHVFALLREAGISDREERLNLFRWIVHDSTIATPTVHPMDEKFEPLHHSRWARQITDMGFPTSGYARLSQRPIPGSWS